MILVDWPVFYLGFYFVLLVNEIKINANCMNFEVRVKWI